ncbi:MAG: MATE family efflux transporter [Chloroflexi bacterium]|nr:MATE family efflux transporter [Chloroflexota bacterium]
MPSSRSFAAVSRRPTSSTRSRPDNLRKEVLRLGLPAVGERILSLLVNIVNTMLVGHLGASALAAVGLSGTIEMIGTTFFQAVAVGATALIAQAIGAKNRSLAQRVLEQSMLVAVGMGLICTVLLLPFSRGALILLGAEPDTVAMGTRYLPYLAATQIMMSVLTVGNAALRGAGDTRTPMVLMGTMNVINALLSLILIRGLGPIRPMGVTGAGVAAGTARTLAGVAMVLLLRSGRARMYLPALLSRPQRDVLERLLQVGLPAGGENLLMRFAFLSYTRALASLGTVAYAAHVIAQRVENLTMMPAFGFAVAATTLCGQALGAGDIPRARASVFRAMEIAVGFCLIGTVFFIAYPRMMLGLFTNDLAVIEMGVLPLQIVAVAQPFMTAASCLSGGLRGSGDTRSVMWVTGIGAWLVRVPVAVAAATVLHLGLPGVQSAMTLDWAVRMSLLWWRFRPSTWKSRAAQAAAAVRSAAAQ